MNPAARIQLRKGTIRCTPAICHFLVSIFCLFVLVPDAAAQCAMCYSSAAGQGPEAARALNVGIVLLFTPAVLLFWGVMIVAARRNHPAAEDDNARPDSF